MCRVLKIVSNKIDITLLFLIISSLLFLIPNINAQEQKKSFLEEFVYPDILRYEATFRSQGIRMPRASINKPLTLKEQLRILYKTVPEFTDSYVCIGSSKNIEKAINISTQTLLDTDPILLVFNIEDGKVKKKYDEPNVSINLGYISKDGSKRYMTFFMRVYGFLNRSLYSRMTIMDPGREFDDLKTYNSHSKPTTGCYITAFSADSTNVADDIKFYEDIEKSMLSKINTDEHLTEMEKCVYKGITEIPQYATGNSYAMKLYNEKRYADAQQLFESFWLYNRNDILAGNTESLNMYQQSCYYMSECLKKLGFYDKANYFWGLAAYQNREYDNGFHELFNNNIKQMDLYNFHETEVNKSNSYSFTIGHILNTIYDILPTYILCGKVSIMNKDKIKTNDLNSSKVWNLDIKSLCSENPALIMLRYSKAKYENESQNDESILFYSNSILISIYKASTIKDLWRVNIMIPNFRGYDFKRGDSDFHTPLMTSFIIGNDSQQWTGNDYIDMFNKSHTLISENRSVEALNGLKRVFTGIKQDFKDKKMPDEMANVYFQSGFWYGYALTELEVHEKAIAYLNPIAIIGGIKEMKEFINALSTVKDIRTIGFIETELKNVAECPESYSNDKTELNSYINFLNRRKAFILIDIQCFDEAEAILKSMQNNETDADKLRLIENELNYIKHMKSAR